MKNRSIPFYLLTLGTVTALVLVIAVSFAVGVALAPQLNNVTHAAPAPPVGDAVQPAALPADPTDLVAAFEQTLIGIHQTALPSVVNIQVTQRVEQPSGFGPPSPFAPFPETPQTPEVFFQRGEGSGFVWDDEGHIVTNYHVVAGATGVEVRFADGRSVEAEVLGTDPDADLAVIKVDLPADELQPLLLGDSDTLQPGQLAIAIGNPFGQEFTMTSGIISAVGRTIRSGNSPFSIPEVIQTDAPINPGNSGGPLLNRSGEVIGINTQIISRSGANAGIGFAVPINIAKQVVPTLIEGGTFEYAWLGITGQTLSPEVANFMELPAGTIGALVINVVQGSPADEAGLQGSDKMLKVEGQEYKSGGDVIVAIDGQLVREMDDLITYLVEETRPGDKVTLDVIRPDGEKESIPVTLGVRPRPNSVSEENR
jgi:2-alkenal reductase